MRRMMIIFAACCLLQAVSAQKTGAGKTDSLLQQLRAPLRDSNRVKLLIALAEDLLQNGKADTAFEISTSALDLAQKTKYQRGEADIHFQLGKINTTLIKNKDALASFRMAAALYEPQKRFTNLAETFYAMGGVYQKSNYEDAIEYYKKAFAAAKQADDKEFLGKSAYITAVMLIRVSNYEEASFYKDLAIRYYKEAGNETGLADCYVVSSRINKNYGNIQQSVQDNYTALRYFERSGNKVGMFNVYTGLGLIYEDQKNWAEAQKNYLSAKKAAEEQPRKEVLAAGLINLGNACRELGNTEDALKCFEEALELSRQTGYKKVVGSSLGNIGTIYSLMNRPADALQKFEEARKIFEELGSKESTSIAYLESGTVYFHMNKPEESRQSVNQALQMAEEIGYKDVISKSYQLLAQIDSATGNYASALENYRLFITYRDSISNAEAARQLSEQRMQYAFSKKEDSLRLQQALIAEQLDKQTLLSKQQQQELELKQSALVLTQRQKDVQELTFLKTQAELQLSNEQQEKKLALAEQEKALQESELEKQTLLAKQKEQEILLKDRKLAVQRTQRNIWLAGLMALLVFSFFIYRNYREKKKANRLLQQQNVELADQRDQIKRAMAELEQTQIQLIQKEKMASLGELTAGIAHEIQNPLNFVNNFSEVNVELGNELKAEVTKLSLHPEQRQNLHDLTDELLQNQQRITHHGKRADAIVKNMLQHSRKSSGAKELTDINALVNECMNLSYHSFRTRYGEIDTNLETHFDKQAGSVQVIPQDLSRVLLNLFNNAFYAAGEQKKRLNGSFIPTVTVSTERNESRILIRITDNGIGIPEQVRAKIFQPFFTTKPTGEGAGLGLSLSYDVITKSHGGEIKVDSTEGKGSTFTLMLPA